MSYSLKCTSLVSYYIIVSPYISIPHHANLLDKIRARIHSGALLLSRKVKKFVLTLLLQNASAKRSKRILFLESHLMLSQSSPACWSPDGRRPVPQTSAHRRNQRFHLRLLLSYLRWCTSSSVPHPQTWLHEWKIRWRS